MLGGSVTQTSVKCSVCQRIVQYLLAQNLTLHMRVILSPSFFGDTISSWSTYVHCNDIRWSRKLGLCDVRAAKLSSRRKPTNCIQKMRANGETIYDTIEINVNEKWHVNLTNFSRGIISAIFCSTTQEFTCVPSEIST